MSSITEILGTDITHRSDLVLSSTGAFEVISGLENLRLALFHRLMTVPGSLIHRPDYGVGIKQFQNAPNTLVNQEQIANRIYDNFIRDSRVEKVLGVQINSEDGTPETLKISVRFKIVGYQDEATLAFIPFGRGVDG
jgi:phage baseplate assembly protein W